MSKTVVVGMSGGVDSSVAALILKEQGYNVIGVTMQIWQDEDYCDMSANGGCCGLSAVEDARRVADVIGIPHYVMNFKEEFRHRVIDYFVQEYEKGHTPNPCIACNRYIKWEALLHRSLEIGADYIATGHYGRIIRLDNGRYTVARSASTAKDQSYVLYSLTQKELAHTLFPICDYEKTQVRAMAAANNLPVAAKKDSQDICFIANHDYSGFIRDYTGRTSQPGNFVDCEGRILGQHRGITSYTPGQRKGLGIAFGRPMYVVGINTENNEVILGEEQELMVKNIVVGDVNYMAAPMVAQVERVLGQIRYSHLAAPCSLRVMKDGRLEAVFDEAVRAPAPGQAAVFYKDDMIVCGGTIGV